MEWKQVGNSYLSTIRGKQFKIMLDKVYVSTCEGVVLSRRNSLEDAKEDCETLVSFWGETTPEITEPGTNKYDVIYREKKREQCRAGKIIRLNYLLSSVTAHTLREAKKEAIKQIPDGYAFYEVRKTMISDNLKKYYGIVTNIYPSGGRDVGIIERSSPYRPENTHYHRTTVEIITEWYDTYEDTEEVLK